MHVARLASFAAIVVASACAVTSTASAQDVDRWSFGAAIGPSLLTGDAGDATGVGFNAALAPELRLGTGPLRLGLELSLGRYGLDRHWLGAPDTPVEGTFSTFALAITGTYHAPARNRVAPFVRGGVGPHGVEIRLDAPAAADPFDETDVGFFGGIGVELRDVRFSPSLEVRYTSISTSGERTSYVPVMVGLRF